MVAIHIKSTILQKDVADMYVLNHFQNSTIIADRLRELCMFKKVKLVDSIEFTAKYQSKRNISYMLSKAKDFVKYRQLANEYFEFGNSMYDEVYFTFADVIIQIAIMAMSKKNKNVKINLYEDAVGGYSAQFFFPSIYKRVFNLFSGFSNTLDKYHRLYLFQPKLFDHNLPVSIHKIPPIDIDKNDYLQIFNELFGYQQKDIIEEKIIYFEQPLESIPGMNNAIFELMNRVLKSDYIVKLHPRSNTKKYSKHNIYGDNSLPWEIICMNSNIDDKVLISYYSAVCFTPKLLFDKEPVVILLFKMDNLPKSSMVSKKSEVFLKLFIETYKDKSRIFVPESYNELEKILIGIQAGDQLFEQK